MGNTEYYCVLINVGFLLSTCDLANGRQRSSYEHMTANRNRIKVIVALGYRRGAKWNDQERTYGCEQGLVVDHIQWCPYLSGSYATPLVKMSSNDVDFAGELEDMEGAFGSSGASAVDRLVVFMVTGGTL